MLLRLCAGGFLIAALVAQAADLEVLSVQPKPVSLHAGISGEARIEITVKPGYHVQANPVLNPFLIPLLLKLKAAAGVTPGAAVYPAAKRIRLSGSDEDLAIYDGRFTLALPLSSSAATSGDVVLDGSLRYQACDDEHCLKPRSVSLKLPISVGR